MKFRPVLIHSCVDQNKVLQWMEPFLYAPIDKKQFLSIWAEAARQLGEVRPEKCRCNYRVSSEDAENLVKNGVADYLITEWRYNEEKKKFFPAPNPNLVWGGKQGEESGQIKASYAAKTPRVQTVEKAHIERAYVGGAHGPVQEDIDRIEAWGDLQHEVWAKLTVTYPDGWECPFRGRAVLATIGLDQRTCPGKTVENKS